MGRDTTAAAKETLSLGSCRPHCSREHCSCSVEAGFLSALPEKTASWSHRENPKHASHTHYRTGSQEFYLIGLLVTSHHAHGLYEGVAGVIHSSLDTLVQGVAIGRHLVAELGVDGRREALGHAVVVFAQIRVVCAV